MQLLFIFLIVIEVITTYKASLCLSIFSAYSSLRVGTNGLINRSGDIYLVPTYNDAFITFFLNEYILYVYSYSLLNICLKQSGIEMFITYLFKFSSIHEYLKEYNFNSILQIKLPQLLT